MAPALLIVITDLGDSALLLPLALVLAAGLWLLQSRTAALTWLGFVLPGLVLLAAVKLIGHACHPYIGPALVSPSGHAAFATMVYGSFGVILACRLEGGVRWLVAAASVALIAGVAASRILLGAHTATEVAAGLMVGGVVVAAFAHRYRGAPSAPFHARRAGLLLAVIVVLAATLHGERLKAEEVLRGIASELGPRVGLCR